MYELQQNDELIALENEVKEMTSRLNEMVARQEGKNDVLQKQTVERFLKNAAASILLFLVGSQPEVSTPSHHFIGKKRAAELKHIE